MAAGIDERLLLGIRVIGYCGVKVEAVKKSGVAQCHNCQRLHHTTGQCNFVYRCVQCVAVHSGGNGPRANNKALPIGCVNCFESKLDHSQHTANDLKNCNFFKRIEKNKAEKRNYQRTSPTLGSSSSTGSQRGFMPVGKSTPSSTRSHSMSSGGQSYASAVTNAGTKSKDINFLGKDTDLVKIIAMTVRGVLAAIQNGI